MLSSPVDFPPPSRPPPQPLPVQIPEVISPLLSLSCHVCTSSPASSFHLHWWSARQPQLRERKRAAISRRT
ncbi:unnamed protein product [Linum trigynum]|uniref:Uncharacterized protein n=1 Tax=Linum trigynum TaxID=586398 RepID=A0AAV2DWE7_9ROSI